VGLNQWDVDEAVDNLRFLPVEGLPIVQNVIEWPSLTGAAAALVPFDWGLLTINTRRNSTVASVQNLAELLAALPPRSLALQDPRTSAPGLSFLFWLIQVMGEDKAFAFLDQLNPKIAVIAPSWSASYGLFQKGHAESVFSYVTSPLYHQLEEKDFNYLALPLSEGLPIHIEYAAVLATCAHCQRAAQFVQFLQSDEAQMILMQKNYMFPVQSSVAAQTPWDIFSRYKVLPFARVSTVEKKRILERWTKWLRVR
jgi:thiamine transport system substrate-binding protein